MIKQNLIKSDNQGLKVNQKPREIILDIVNLRVNNIVKDIEKLKNDQSRK